MKSCKCSLERIFSFFRFTSKNLHSAVTFRAEADKGAFSAEVCIHVCVCVIVYPCYAHITLFAAKQRLPPSLFYLKIISSRSIGDVARHGLVVVNQNWELRLYPEMPSKADWLKDVAAVVF